MQTGFSVAVEEISSLHLLLDEIVVLSLTFLIASSKKTAPRIDVGFLVAYDKASNGMRRYLSDALIGTLDKHSFAGIMGVFTLNVGGLPFSCYQKWRDG